MWKTHSTVTSKSHEERGQRIHILAESKSDYPTTNWQTSKDYKIRLDTTCTLLLYCIQNRVLGVVDEPNKTERFEIEF